MAREATTSSSTCSNNSGCSSSTCSSRATSKATSSKATAANSMVATVSKVMANSSSGEVSKMRLLLAARAVAETTKVVWARMPLDKP